MDAAQGMDGRAQPSGACARARWPTAVTSQERGNADLAAPPGRCREEDAGLCWREPRGLRGIASARPLESLGRDLWGVACGA